MSLSKTARKPPLSCSVLHQARQVVVKDRVGCWKVVSYGEGRKEQELCVGDSGSDYRMGCAKWNEAAPIEAWLIGNCVSYWGDRMKAGANIYSNWGGMSTEDCFFDSKDLGFLLRKLKLLEAFEKLFHFNKVLCRLERMVQKGVGWRESRGNCYTPEMAVAAPGRWSREQ